VRTTLVDENGKPLYTNELANEDSPYLIQHAHNPVNWVPWGDKAFETARREDKPIFLSIGYSTCHWCHVMEAESFDNLQIAEFLNEHFVSIKLDREQRPDLDDVYMTGLQIMKGQGGWPMSNFLTHEGYPFYAGTYYPPANFLNLLGELAEAWRTKRKEVQNQASEISNAIRQYTSAKSDASELGVELISRAAAELVSRLDEINGGFGGAPKFPNESQLLLLIDDVRRNQSEDSLHGLTLTLDKMYQGGIYDQVAGGFHRYAVDSEWLVPHFEKMLYNQAQLLSVYSQAWGLTGDPSYKRVAKEIADYVLRDMTDPQGGFYSATDADSEGEEGLFFVWTPSELKECLTEEQLALVTDIYGVTGQGNFEGNNILNLEMSLEDYADSRGLKLDELHHDLRMMKESLYQKRELRIHPLRDEKVITGWNGMMISSLAIASHELAETRFMDAALAAAERIWDLHVMKSDQGTIDFLWRISLDGCTSIPGNLEDHACLAEAMLRLYQFGGRDEFKTRGEQLLTLMDSLFTDEQEGGYFISATETAGPMITRPKSPMDGATPSANSFAVRALTLSTQVNGNLRRKQAADKTTMAFSGLIQATPSAFSYMVTALSDLQYGSRELVQFASDGNVRVAVRRTIKSVLMSIRIVENWHINAQGPGTEELIATEVVPSDDIASVDYPESIKSSVSFSDSRLSLYEGSVEIQIKTITESPCQLQLRFQTCDDRVCLSPELLTFYC